MFRVSMLIKHIVNIYIYLPLHLWLNYVNVLLDFASFHRDHVVSCIQVARNNIDKLIKDQLLHTIISMKEYFGRMIFFD